MQTLFGILIAIFVFGIMIFLHELGHYLAARACKVKVLEFAVGMGPKLFSFTSKKTGIVYSLRLLPIGAPANTTADRIVEMVPDTLDKLAAFLDERKEKKAE